MAIILNRQISDTEKSQVIERDGRICYATSHEIPDNEQVHFDHIRAFASGGISEIDNIAPMCQQHNLAKGRLPLEDFRIKLRMDAFFKRGTALTLKDELQYFKEETIIHSFGESVYYKEKMNNSTIELEFSNQKQNYKLYTCPITKWKYFYATLPVNIINSDDDNDGKVGLQLRYLIQDKVFNLFRHFQTNTVLHPSIARLYENKILVFDGQHKIAAMLWNERKEFELKVYINPEPKSLNQTNISAHDKFAQTRFFSSVMIAKLGTQFGKDFEEYKMSEKERQKTEAGFVRFLEKSEQLTKSDVKKRLISFIYDSILDVSTNKITKLVSRGNKGTKECPITVDSLGKSIFSNFIYSNPTDDDITTSNYKRDTEILNTIKLCNIFEEELLHKYDSQKTDNDTTQLIINRIIRPKSMLAWSELLRDAVAAKLEITDADEKMLIFYREICDDNFNKIKDIVRRLLKWKDWKTAQNSDIDKILSTGKKDIKEYFKRKGLTTGYLLGAAE
jgi:hypothetical protein